MAEYRDPLAAEAQTKYVRTREGEVVHLRECSRLKLATRTWPWLWADGRHVDTIAYAVREVGLHDCQTCRPIAEATPDLRHAKVTALDQQGPGSEAAS